MTRRMRRDPDVRTAAGHQAHQNRLQAFALLLLGFLAAAPRPRWLGSARRH
ncbi:hypothetical protein LY12_002943 [Prauserella alba]|nr:hypothetical protein [Prauserella alba]